MSQGTNLGSQKGRWIILAALVAVLGALLFLLPGGLLQAQQTAETYYYNENSDEPVVTLTANDPEGVTPIQWDIFIETGDNAEQDLPGGVDGDDIVEADTEDGDLFKVEGGVLSFKSSPDFEMTLGGTANDSNTYKVVVQASDGGVTEWVQYFKVTVNVLDVEEQGKVTWLIDPDGAGTEPGPGTDGQDLLEFQAGAILTAMVMDPDGPATPNTMWRWYRSQNNTGPWTMITDALGVPEMAATYTASDSAANNDVGLYLRAVAEYTDNRGGNKTAELVSPYTVKATKVENNSVPEFAPTSVERGVAEEVGGANVGAPVTATDADNHVLNYSIVDPEGAGDARYFKIDSATGQIKTKTLTELAVSSLDLLDYETPLDTTGDDANDNVYEVIVRATDSLGANTDTGATDVPEDATVSITLQNVNEAPDFLPVVEDRTADLPVNLVGVADERGEEGVGNIWNTPPAEDVDYEFTPFVVSSYTVDDPEGVVINEGKWNLTGDDKAKFQLTGTGDNTRRLEFIDKPDFENPGDSNRDNIYEVTVVASDGEEQATRAVTAKITDRDEAGVITLSNENPVAGKALTATLKDSDGDVINDKWQWYALTDLQIDAVLAANADDANDAARASAIAALDVAHTAALANNDTDIEFARSKTYTPVPGDIGFHLVAAATSYMDRTEDEDNDPETPDLIADFIRFDNRAQSDPSAPVKDDPANAPPEFVEGEAATRYVEEDNDADRPNRPFETIGAPVVAKDADNSTLAYSLSGIDAASFSIMEDSDGQLMTKAPLDFETKDTYTVVITADDGSKESNATDQITVTIEVKDLDEKPTLTSKAGGLAILGPSSSSVAEGSTGTVATYTAEGATLSLAGADSSDFNFSGGALSFRNTPNFEAPADADGNNTYMVTVMAADGDRRLERAVTVRVTDVDELGRLSGPATASRMENSTEAVGTYMASGGTMSELANWTLMGDDMGDLSISTSGVLTFDAPPNYEMPVDEDMDNTYEVTVKAEAGGEVDMVDVTVTVTNQDEEGMVTLMPMRPSIGMEITATLTDPDMMVTDTTWQWSRSMEMEEGYTDITGATSAMYTPMEADEGYYLKATASYTDGEVSGKMAEKITGSQVRLFAIDGPISPSYVENGTAAVATYIASGDAAPTWTLEGADAGDFTITGGMLRFMSSPNYEMPMDADTNNVYMVTVKASDGTLTDAEPVTVTVTNVDEAGTVTLTPMAPSVDTEITAELSDDDGGITGTTWQWGSADAMDGPFTDISGEILASYNPVEGDAGMYLRATATYGDAEGSGKTATSETVMISADVVGRYDGNDDGAIDIHELFDAVDDYFNEEISISQLFEVVDAYFG